ncbi:hypothetical protein CALVIDRAFT_568062 [Calocera viscosa TUFC12733]|uniref:Ribosomal RNA large subunit methyltransferase K/L-like methyltransferase domain-containing protein n=1 Tax=Calocera viscosa (strain TUFC12733) TaxID=1330018 RepID=A0A167HH00_CALVF|nr:hypothetical protein CALVIDRAFT_568062 [Calocera viscosa TUFC12733]
MTEDHADNPSLSNILTLAFHVPTGLEDYALVSILTQLALVLPQADLQVAAALSSSHVLIRFPNEPLLRQTIQVCSSGALWAVYDAFICLAELSLEDVRPALEEEFWTMQRIIGGRAKEKQKGKVGTKQSDDVHVQGLGDVVRETDTHEDYAEPPTPGEERFMSSLLNLITSHFLPLDHALQLLQPPELSFRATFSNPSRLLPLSTLHKRNIERDLGEAVTQHLTREWKVKLVDPALDVQVRLLPSSVDWRAHTLGTPPPVPVLEPEAPQIPAFPKRLTALLAIALPAAAVPPHRLPHLIGTTPLSPPIAHLLALMHPVFSPPNAGSPILLDPCAGLGSIPREILALSSQRDLGLQVLAGDISLPSLLLSQQCTPALCALQYNGAHRLPLRSPLLGGFITDLPWGTRHLSARQIAAFYPALVRRMADVVERDGVGVLMSAARGALEGALKQGGRWWEKVGCREVKVGGRAVWVWVIRRTTTAT